MKKSGLFLSATGLTLLLSANPSFAKGDEANLAKLGVFKRTDTGAMERVPQGGQYAENLKKVLQKIRMPEGFKIELFAIVPDCIWARSRSQRAPYPKTPNRVAGPRFRPKHICATVFEAWAELSGKLQPTCPP